MEPQLVAISGSLKGTTFALAKTEVYIGREASNTIALNEPSISRRHCVIKQQPDADAAGEKLFTVVDLESYNGTFVNSLPVTEQLLAHGDQIALGDVQFLFLTRESESTLPVAQLDEDDLITRSTLKLRGEDSLYSRPERVSAELPSNSRVAQDLNTLVALSSVINCIRDRKTLQHRLLELTAEAFPVERAAILLVDEGEGFLDLAQGWNRLKGFDDSVRVSQTVTGQVLQEKVALLSNDIFENQVIGGAPSLVASRVCSLLCVPLIAFEKPLGVIYLDTSDTAARFDEGHLQLLTAIAGIAAIALQNASQFEWLEGENTRLQQEVRLQHEMVGDSPRMSDVYSFLAKVAAGESTVLLRGESGTGKELAAHAIHLNGPRSAKPFVAINCATLTETLLESELFGHEKGAFTGAIAQKRGKLEIADGGTIFLDEVGELTPLIQAKLLRVLQEREFERVGGTRPVKVDVRIIAATNKDLEQAIKAGSFRQDLYYRLNVVSIAMPPLKERRADIPLLANYFVANYSRKCKRKVMGISPDARRLLQNYDWPGNVRELENAIERAVVLGSTALIEPDDLPEVLFESGQAAAQPTKYYEAINESKKQIIMKTLKETGGNYTEAARLLGVHPNNLHRIIRSLNLKTTTK